MVSVVLEAAQQMVDSGKTPCAFNLRDISFLATITLPKGMATEFLLHMRPHLIATTCSTPAAWWDFAISSAMGPTGQLRDNRGGLMTIVYEEQRSSQMAGEDTSIDTTRIADYRGILLEYPETCSKAAFYDRMAKCAFRYGELFQEVENYHISCGKTAFEMRHVDIGETFSQEQLDRPFLIHAATLDAVFQGSLGSTGSRDNIEFGFDKPYLPTAIGELEISVDIPAEAGYWLPGLCRSQKYGFNDWSSGITMFNKEYSKVVSSVTDFRLLEVEMDVGNADVLDVDPSETTSEPCWNYSLDLIEPAEISQVMSSVATTNHRLFELIRMAVHQRPSIDVIELVAAYEQLSNAAMSKLSSDTILPTQVRHTLAHGACDNHNHNSILGQLFAVGALDTVSSPDIAPADLIVVSHRVSYNFKDFNGILERLMSLAKPDAIVLITTPAASNNKQVALPVLRIKGF